jgi:hypothetical protein
MTMLYTNGSMPAMGMTTNEAVSAIPRRDDPGSSVGFFVAHADRTTANSHDGQQVLQAHLWGGSAIATGHRVWSLDQLLRQNWAIKEIHRVWVCML